MQAILRRRHACDLVGFGLGLPVDDARAIRWNATHAWPCDLSIRPGSPEALRLALIGGLALEICDVHARFEKLVRVGHGRLFCVSFSFARVAEIPDLNPRLRRIVFAVSGLADLDLPTDGDTAVGVARP